MAAWTADACNVGGNMSKVDWRSYSRNFEGLAVDSQGYIYPENINYGSARRYVNDIANSLGEDSYREEIDAHDLAGIQVGIEEQLDPERFWSQHDIRDKATGEIRKACKNDYLSLASKIPAVCEALEQGRSFDEVCADPELGEAALKYFSEPRVLRAVADENGYYELTGLGRHRALAARELGLKIPVKIIAKYQEQKQEVSLENDNSLDSEYDISW